MKTRIIVTLLLGLVSLPAAALDIVATTASMGALARSVGGEAVAVEVLAPPDRDAHYLQARPSMIRALRGADLLVAVGADLEVGWLPAAIANAANPALNPGAEGYFEAAAQVGLLGAGAGADRALGDVHPTGNPHLHLDPLRMGRVALALAERLARLDPSGARAYRQHAAQFAERAEEALAQLLETAAGAPGAVLFHKDGDYLFARLGIPVLGYLEPVPGIPPTARHLKGLQTKLTGRAGVVLRHAYQPATPARRLAEQLDWPVREVALEPAVDAGADGYFALLQGWAQAIAAGRR